MAKDAAASARAPSWAERSEAAGRLLGDSVVPLDAISPSKLKALKVSYMYNDALFLLDDMYRFRDIRTWLLYIVYN